jgi:hypothetical protein
VTQNPRTQNPDPEPGTLNSERDTAMTATYVRVIVVEAVILVLLWILGRTFS